MVNTDWSTDIMAFLVRFIKCINVPYEAPMIAVYSIFGVVLSLIRGAPFDFQGGHGSWGRVKLGFFSPPKAAKFFFFTHQMVKFFF